MAIHSKPKKSPLEGFVSMIVPDRIEEAYDRVCGYFSEHLKLSFDTPEGVTGVLNELIRDHGEPVRQALYALLCGPDKRMRQLVPTSLTESGGAAAVGVLVPVLVVQFALAPAVALLVATLVMRAVIASGEKAVCEGMILQHRKVARVIRAREHAVATSATPKSRRSSSGTAAKTGTGSRKKAGKPRPAVRSEGAASQKGTDQPSPKSVRKPYPKPKSSSKSES